MEYTKLGTGLDSREFGHRMPAELPLGR